MDGQHRPRPPCRRDPLVAAQVQIQRNADATRLCNPKWLAGLVGMLFMIIGCSGEAKPASDPRRVFRDPTTIELAVAIAADDASKVRELAKRGADLSARGQDEVTLLQWAMLRERPAMVKLLLQTGADPSQRGFDQMTALHMAAMAKGKPYLALMLDHGADPNVRGGRTEAPVLSEALMNGNAEAVALLLAHRANPNLTDRQGDTPLHIAAQINDYANMLALLKAGADPTIRNVSGKTFAAYFAIHPKESMMSWEARSSRQAVVTWLKEHAVPIEEDKPR